MSEFREWAILELMGHRRLAGEVSESEIGGAKFIRIDVPKGQRCEGLAASWCPNCGDCKCPDEERERGNLNDPDCPIHGRDSKHAPDAYLYSSQFYSPAAVYCITPTSEETARRFAQATQPAPISKWDLPGLPPARGDEDAEDDRL